MVTFFLIPSNQLRLFKIIFHNIPSIFMATSSIDIVRFPLPIVLLIYSIIVREILNRFTKFKLSWTYCSDVWIFRRRLIVSFFKIKYLWILHIIMMLSWHLLSSFINSILVNISSRCNDLFLSYSFSIKWLFCVYGLNIMRRINIGTINIVGSVWLLISINLFFRNHWL